MTLQPLLVVGATLPGDPALGRVAAERSLALRGASGREEALRLLASFEPACVLLETKLEDGDAFDLLVELRRLAPLVQAIVVAPSDATGAALEALRAGAIDLLRAPLEVAELDSALERADRRRLDRRQRPSPALLLVEDHAATRRHLGRVLRRQGYRILDAADGAEAIEVLDRERVDVIVTDLRMPGMDGLGVLRRAKALDPYVEVLVVSGHGEEDTVLEALREGAVNFLRKPIDLDQMLAALDKALDYRALRLRLAASDHDLAAIREVVLRLDHQLVIEASPPLDTEALAFLRELVSMLPFCILVARSDGAVVYCNRGGEPRRSDAHDPDLSGPPSSLMTVGYDGTAPLPSLDAAWLSSIGITGLEPAALQGMLERTFSTRSATMETLDFGRWGSVVMTPIELDGPGGRARYAAVAIRGERTGPQSSIPPGGR